METEIHFISSNIKNPEEKKEIENPSNNVMKELAESSREELEDFKENIEDIMETKPVEELGEEDEVENKGRKLKFKILRKKQTIKTRLKRVNFIFRIDLLKFYSQK